jgi:hypothetical protein
MGTERGEDGVPLYLGPLCACVSCLIGGLTGFGDAITLHIMWALAGLMGVVPMGRRETLAKAVTYT